MLIYFTPWTTSEGKIFKIYAILSTQKILTLEKGGF